MGLHELKKEHRVDKQVRDEWVSALRSGEYEQGRGRLCTSDGRMCCLGVLADVAIDTEWTRFDPDGGNWLLDGASAFLTSDHLEIVGLSGSDQDRCARMNDTARMSFGEIADWIEANL